VIDFFISISMELKVIFLAGLFIVLLEYIKSTLLKKVRKINEHKKK